MALNLLFSFKRAVNLFVKRVCDGTVRVNGSKQLCWFFFKPADGEGRSSVESYRSFTFSDEDFVDLVVDFVNDLFHRCLAVERANQAVVNRGDDVRRV